MSPAQQRYYQAQARRLDRLAGEAKALNAAIRWTASRAATAPRDSDCCAGKSANRTTSSSPPSSRCTTRSNVATPTSSAETRGEMERREALCDRYEGELSAIEREIHTTRDREQTETEQREQQQQQHKRGRSI